jgi:hypothetical protein
MDRRLIGAFAGLLVLGACLARPPQAPLAPLTLAAIGDSITRATHVCCEYGDHPDRSWSTGSGTEEVVSHAERLRTSGYDVSAVSVARAGARIDDAPRQAQAAVNAAADYVTFLLGANDACASTVDAMTPVPAFRADLERALAILDRGLSADARVFVASVPDVARLWEVLRDDEGARFTWNVAGICSSVLGPDATDADRRAVTTRVAAYNAIIVDACGRYERCRDDGAAVFVHRFAAEDVSPLDHFHPSLSGQAALAEITWSRSWWAS